MRNVVAASSPRIRYCPISSRGYEKRVRVSASVLSLWSALLFAANVCAADPPSGNLADLSLEELGNIVVTTVSKRAERLSDAAAAVYVITAEDIRRSGVRSLAEALRLAPNLQVAQVSAYGYAISARGFNNSAANKLLVLIDGRSVYNPLFSGVFWDVQNPMLEDIERIEVVSGPGGTLWGTNAVNGVINVITRSSKNTQGTLLAGGGGTRDSGVVLRYGGAAEADGYYRVYGTYFDRDNSKTESGEAKDDARYMSQGGFRTDWNRGADQLMVQGNVYGGAEGQPVPGSVVITGVSVPLGAISLSGGNLNGRWEHLLDDGSSFSLQAYYDRNDRTVPPIFTEKLDIVDLQFQHSIKPIGIHSAIWGAEYRRSSDRVVNGVLIAILPATVHQQWTSLFAQDEIMLRDDLRLTVGARLERNDYTGNEFLPTVRIAWKVAPEHLLWAAATRTVRAPSRLDRDTFYPGSPPFLLAGGPDFQSEIANVYEVGYRGQIAESLSYSVTVFHSDYDRLHTQEIAPSRTFLFFGNGMEGKSTGVEMWGTYQASRAWRLSAGFSGLRERLTLKPGSHDTSNALEQQGRDPAQSWMMRSSMDLPYQTELDLGVRHVSALATPTVPAYTAVDLRYGWRPNRNLELSITGQNLFGNGHAEFSDALTRSVVERNVFFKAVFKF